MNTIIEPTNLKNNDFKNNKKQFQRQFQKQITQAMIKDRYRLSTDLMRLDPSKIESNPTPFQRLQNHLQRSLDQVQSRQNSRPAIVYSESLPISQKRDQISQLIQHHQVVVIAGETGSGKTTQLPKICLELGLADCGMIGHTQPRRIAARAVATRIAEELASPLGQCVGYKVRFSDNSSAQTQIKVMTDGILLAEIQKDPYLNQYSVLIIDEAHERSLNIDFILGYLKNLLNKRRDLKVIITSATIDVQRFSEHFTQDQSKKVPVIEVSGRTYPVEIRYRPFIDADLADEQVELAPNGMSSAADQMEAMILAVRELFREGPGDILIFFSGEREIRDATEVLQKCNFAHTQILPLYARLSSSEQQRIFQVGGGRRIILSTNVAETSLTVPGIRYVIDTGLARISRYSARTKVQRLPIEAISQASANQRSGRCGRVEAGICIRLYDEDDLLNRPLFTDPEILRTNLAAVMLQMVALGLGDIAKFPFVDAPDPRQIQDGMRLLLELNAITQHHEQLKLTELGRQMSLFPLDPKLSRMLLAASKVGALFEILIIVAVLAIQDPRENPSDKQQASNEQHRRFYNKESDFLTYINLWHYIQQMQQELSNSQFRKLCQKEFLNYLRLREWQDLVAQLTQICQELKLQINQEPASYQPVHQSLLTGMLANIGMKNVVVKNAAAKGSVTKNNTNYQGTRNSAFDLFPTSALFKSMPAWVVAAELVETSRLWARQVAKIDPEWLLSLATHLTKVTYSEPHWQKKSASIQAYMSVTLYGLPIVVRRKVDYGTIDIPLCRELFIRSALVEGDWQCNHQFFKTNLSYLADVETLEHKVRRRDILVDDQDLFDFYDERIGEDVVSGQHFDAWWKRIKATDPERLTFDPEMLKKRQTNEVNHVDYPDYWQQGNLKLPLRYQFEPGAVDDGVTLVIPLAVLNQVVATPQGNGFDWLVPGLRQELVIALIKSLVKVKRRHFVPAPNYAQAALQRIESREDLQKLPFLVALSKALLQITSVTIDVTDWQIQELPAHLTFNFEVVEEIYQQDKKQPQKQKVLASGRDLGALKIALQPALSEILVQVAQSHGDDPIEQHYLTQWPQLEQTDEVKKGTLPQSYQQLQSGFEIKAYPALVDKAQSVSIQLFDSPQRQAYEMRLGLRRLLLLNIPSPIKFLHHHLPNKTKLALYANPCGTVVALIDDCIAATLDQIIDSDGGLVWSEDAFEQLLANVKAQLNDKVIANAYLLEQILISHAALTRRFKGKLDLTLAMAMSDIKGQVSALIYKGFITDAGVARLKDIQRYLQAVERRLDLLAIDPIKDRSKMLVVQQLQQSYQALYTRYQTQHLAQEKLAEIRWMIEELRVSFFAQQLGTNYAVSEKRVKFALSDFENTLNLGL